jgi:recombination protein RecR
MPFPKPITQLIAALGKLPGVGPKTAERYAFAVVKMPRYERDALARAISITDSALKTCGLCHNFTESDPCGICSDASRDRALLCIVATEREIQSIEQTGVYKGLYHVLGGLLSPALGITPADLTLRELAERLNTMRCREVILALDPTIEGETTSLFVASTIGKLGIPMTRLARGLPRGAEVSYADEITLSDALAGRKKVEPMFGGVSMGMPTATQESASGATEKETVTAEEKPF